MKAGDFSGPANERHSYARAELQKIFYTRTRDEWFDFLAKADVCVGKVYDVPEVFADPQVRHRQMAVELEHPVAGKVTQAGVAVKVFVKPGSGPLFVPAPDHHPREEVPGRGHRLRDDGAPPQR